MSLIYNIKQISPDKYNVLSINDSGEVVEDIKDYRDYFYIEDRSDISALLKQNSSLIKSIEPVIYKEKKLNKVNLSVSIHSREGIDFVWKTLAKKNFTMYEHDVPDEIKFIYQHNFNFLNDLVKPDAIPFAAFDIEVQTKPGIFPNVIDNFIFAIGAEGINYKKEHIYYRKTAHDFSSLEHYAVEGERELLKDFLKFLDDNKIVILSGFNSYNFDMYFVNERLKKYNIPFSFNGDTVKQIINDMSKNGMFRHPLSRVNMTEYRKWDSEKGRIMFFDLMFYLYRTPEILREIQYLYGSASLKSVSDYFGLVSKKERTMIEGSHIYEEFLKDPEKLASYLNDDIVSTFKLYLQYIPNMMFMSYYTNTPMGLVFDSSSTQIIERGLYKNMKNKGLLIYPKNNTPISEKLIDDFSGGNVQLNSIGYFKNVGKLDFKSLYPSIMLDFKIKPAIDVDNIILSTMEGLYTQRISYKNEAAKLKKKSHMPGGLTKEEEDRMSIMEIYSAALKIFINATYGLLGSKIGNKPLSRFTDLNAAIKVTTTGRYMITSMEDLLLKNGFILIETDTDGVYLVHPLAKTKEDIQRMCEDFAHKFDTAYRQMGKEHMSVDVDPSYDGMISIAMKNYMLFNIDTDGSLKIKMKGSKFINSTHPQLEKDLLKDIVHDIVNQTPMQDLQEKYSFLYISPPLKKDPSDFIGKYYGKKDKFMYIYRSKDSSAYKSEKANDLTQKVLMTKWLETYGVEPSQGTDIRYYKKALGVRTRDQVELEVKFDPRAVNYRDYLMGIKRKFIEIILEVYETKLRNNLNVEFDEKEKEIKIKKLKSADPYSDSMLFEKRWMEKIFTEMTGKVKKLQISNMENYRIVGIGGITTNYFRPVFETTIDPQYSTPFLDYMKEKFSGMYMAKKKMLVAQYKKYTDINTTPVELKNLESELSDNEMILFRTRTLPLIISLD